MNERGRAAPGLFENSKKNRSFKSFTEFSKTEESPLTFWTADACKCIG